MRAGGVSKRKCDRGRGVGKMTKLQCKKMVFFLSFWLGTVEEITPDNKNRSP